MPLEGSGNEIKIFGGIAGSDTLCQDADTCNNCVSDLALACNEMRIYDDTELKIDVSSDSTSGVIIILESSSHKVLFETSDTTPMGTHAKVTTTWGDICRATGISGCYKNINTTLTVGVDGNGDGDLGDNEDDVGTLRVFVNQPEDQININTVGDCYSENTTNGACYFVAFPGDEKVFITQLKFGHPRFSTSGLIQFDRLRVYISETNFTSALPGQGDSFYVDLDLLVSNDSENNNNGDNSNSGGNNNDSDSSGGDQGQNGNDESDANNGDESGSSTKKFKLKSEAIMGLKNGVTYYFRLAVVDETNNIAYFSNEDYIKNIEVNGLKVCDPEGEHFDAQDCPYAVIPENVSGLLSKDFNCFIATAAYGSQFAPKVKTFRQFRNRFLLSHSAGQYLTGLYYKYSPFVAQKLATYPTLRQWTRWVLWPLWVFAKVSLKVGLVTTTLIFLFGTCAIIFFSHSMIRFCFIFIFIGSFFLGEWALSEEESFSEEKSPLGSASFLSSVEPPPLGSIRLGIFSPENLKNIKTNTFFSEIYQKQVPVILLDYDWKPSYTGPFSLKAGFGFMASRGHGAFENSKNLKPRESFLFMALPLSFSLAYKIQYWKNQMWVPYVDGGTTVLPFVEFREDGQETKWGGAFAGHFTLGSAFSFHFLGPDVLQEWEQDYGIKSLWLTVEVRSYTSMSKDFDFSGEFITLGFTMGL